MTEPLLRSCYPEQGVCQSMDHYHLWFDLRPGVKDLEMVEALHEMLGHLESAALITGYRVQRRKLGFGPSELGEWHVDIVVRDMAQLQETFDTITPRTGKIEKLHAAVWSKVAGLRTGLWRDFPDPNRA